MPKTTLIQRPITTQSLVPGAKLSLFCFQVHCSELMDVDGAVSPAGLTHEQPSISNTTQDFMDQESDYVSDVRFARIMQQ